MNEVSKKSWFGRGSMFLAAGLFAVTLTLSSTEAARVGGGRSIGKQSSTVTQQRQAQPAQSSSTQTAAPAKPTAAPQTAPQPAAQPARNRWLGPLAGLAAGLGIAALLSHFGMGEGVANFLMIALLIAAVVFVISFLLRKLRGSNQTPAPYRPAYQYSAVGQETVTAPPPSQLGGSYAGTAVAQNPAAHPANLVTPRALAIPEGFDVENFVHNAKVSFIRLQAAFDAANLDDLREFTTPEMFAELRLQLQERGSAAQRTDVVTLNAEMLGVETHATESLASVRFSGMLREEADQAANPIDEVWNFSRPLDGSSGWVLAGIQQLN